MSSIVNSSRIYDIGLAMESSLRTYHGKVVQTFHKLPPNSKLKEIILRIIRILVAPVAYPLLAVVSICGKCLLGRVSKSIKTGIILRQQIDQLIKTKNANWQDQAITLIKKSRYDILDDEINRLRAAGILTSKREALLDNSIGHVQKPSSSPIKQKQSKVLMGQALEIKDIYQSSHDVFIHAQATQWVVLTYLIKEMVKKFNPELNARHFKFLRNPPDEIAKPEEPPVNLVVPAKPLTKCERITKAFKRFLGCDKETKKPEDVRTYVNSKLWINDNNMETRDDLLSTDGYFYNFSTYESSLFFLINNTNIMANTGAIEKFTRNVFKQFCPSLKGHEINKYAKKVVNAAYKGDFSGNLFTLLIPKEDSEKAQYRAHPFGAVCTCHPKEKDKEILAQLQNEVFDHTNKCSPLLGGPIVPQFRIYTPALKPGNGKKIFLLTPFAKQERKKVKAQIKAVANDVFNLAKARGDLSPRHPEAPAVLASSIPQ